MKKRRQSVLEERHLMYQRLGTPGLEAFQAGGVSSLGSQETNANSRRHGPTKLSYYQPRTRVTGCIELTTACGIPPPGTGALWSDMERGSGGSHTTEGCSQQSPGLEKPPLKKQTDEPWVGD